MIDLSKVVNTLKKKYTETSMGSQETNLEFVSTGNKAFDLIADGGVPFGYIVEFAGFSSSGKSLMTQQIIANAQRDYGAIGILIDRENAYTKERGEQLGISSDNLLIAKPQDVPTALEAFNFIFESISEIRKQDKTIKIVVGIDSISAFGKDVDLEKSDQGRKAKSIHEGLRELLTHTDKNTMVIVANQYTYKIGVSWGNPVTTTSGEAMKYYSTLRFSLENRKDIIDEKRGNETTGNWIGVEVSKTRLGPCKRECYLPHFYKTGIDYYGGYARLLSERGFLEPKNKSEFKSFKQHTLKYGENVINEFKMKEALEKFPELDFQEYPEYNLNGKEENNEEGEE